MSIESIWTQAAEVWRHFAESFRWWDVVGYVGTAIFASRFLLQWYVSEKLKRSVIPHAFWWLSLCGSLTLAVYFIGLGNGPGVLGNVPNAAVYIRNLQLIRKQRLASQRVERANTEPHAPQDPDPAA